MLVLSLMQRRNKNVRIGWVSLHYRLVSVGTDGKKSQCTQVWWVSLDTLLDSHTIPKGEMTLQVYLHGFVTAR